MKWFEFDFKVRFRSRSIELTNERGLRILIWEHIEGGGASYARWQWDFRGKPYRQKRENMPNLICVGAGIVPVIGTRGGAVIDRFDRLDEAGDTRS